MLAAVREAVGDDYVVGCRYLADEIIERGSDAQDAAWFGVEFARAGMDFLSLSRGGKFEDAKRPAVGQAAYPYTGPSGYECMPQFISDARGPFGRNVEPVAAIRDAVRAAGCQTPVVLTGGIHGFRQAEDILQADKADIIGFAQMLQNEAFGPLGSARNTEYVQIIHDAGMHLSRLIGHVLDLAQVEGLADLIDAETEAQRVQALRVLSGSLGQLVDRWRENLLRAAALLEVTIDFADEEVPVDVTPEVVALLTPVMADLAREIAGVDVAERIRDGFEVAIIGAPNAGKSTLLNAISGRDIAITSEIAGTTRDVIEVRMDIGGLPVTFLDTAGLRETEDSVEKIGVQRAVARSEAADLRVFLCEEDEKLMVQPLPDDIQVLPKADIKAGNLFQ